MKHTKNTGVVSSEIALFQHVLNQLVTLINANMGSRYRNPDVQKMCDAIEWLEASINRVWLDESINYDDGVIFVEYSQLIHDACYQWFRPVVCRKSSLLVDAAYDVLANLPLPYCTTSKASEIVSDRDCEAPTICKFMGYCVGHCYIVKNDLNGSVSGE